MAIVSFFTRLFHALLGLAPEGPSGPVLARRGAAWFAGDSGSTARRACAVAAYRREPGLPPAIGAAVRCRVLGGPFELPGGAREAVVLTDDAGVATVDIRVTARGAGLVDARLEGDEASAVAFEGRSEVN